MVGLGGRGTGTLGTIEGSALLAQKMEMVALADINPETLAPHKSKGYALFGTASELIQVSVPSQLDFQIDLTGVAPLSAVLIADHSPLAARRVASSTRC